MSLKTGLADGLCHASWRKIGELAEHTGACAVAIGVFAIAVRLLALPWLPIPQPIIHDEFCYRLAADTFASGRITNPSHPLSQFFEAPHVLVVPTYISKFPPAQGLMLAVGLLLGNSWFGVLASFGIMCGAIYWMARGFMPARWALMAGLLPLAYPGINSYWCNSYWGGCMAAIGAALVFGACARSLKTATASHLTILCLGLVILLNSRPFEGLVTAVTPLMILFFSWCKKGFKPAANQIILPITVLVLCAAGMLLYNYQVTGNALRMPYFEYQNQYDPVPVWFGVSLFPEHAYNNPQLAEFYKFYAALFSQMQTPAGWLKAISERLFVSFNFFAGIWLAPLAMASLLGLKDKRMTVLWLSTGFLAVAQAEEVWFHCHYVAPITAPLYVLFVQGFRHLRLCQNKALKPGLVLGRITLCLVLLGFMAGLLALPNSGATIAKDQNFFPRAQFLAQLTALPGKHLVVVHYGQGHFSDLHLEVGHLLDYVYNDADIDKSKVVWARDLGEEKNKKLFDYFHDRDVWIVDADSLPYPRLMTLKESLATPLSRKAQPPAQQEDD